MSKEKKPLLSSAGQVLLEQALVLPLLLTFIFGAIDIANLLRSYAALREGVKTALRCVYTIDGKCVSASAAPPQRLFNWYVVNRNPRIFVDMYDYSGRASWLEGPQYTYRNIQARVLHEVSFEIARQNFSALPNFNLQLTDTPYLAGVDPRDPQFTFPRSRSSAYPLSMARSPAVTLTRSAEQDVIARFSIAAPFRDPTLDCFAVQGFNSAGAGNIPSSDSCSNRRGQTRVVLHVRGEKAGAQNTRAKVLLDLYSDGRLLRSLGGQYFGPEPDQGASEWRTANFFPRGVSADEAHMADTIRFDEQGQVRTEFQLYGELSLDFDRSYTLVARLGEYEGSGDISWRLNAVDIYASLFRDASGAAQDLGCLYSPAQAQSILSAQGGPGHGSYVISSSPSCNPEIQTQSCPANQGVSQQADADGKLRNSAQALQLCAPAAQGDAQLFGANIQNPAWSESSRTVQDELIWSAAQCGQNLQLPEQLQNYPKLVLPDPEVMYTHLALPYSNDTTPAWLKANDSRFSCQEILLAERAFDERSRPALTSDSLFIGNHPDLGTCTPERLRADALANGTQNTDYFEYQARPKGSKCYSAGNSECSAGCAEIASLSQDSCVPFRNGSACSSEKTLITSEPLPEGQIPQACVISADCASEFAGFSGGYQGGIEFDTRKAVEDFGLREIQSAVPQARFDCSKDNCVSFEVNQSPPGASQVLSARASIKVPVGLLLGNSITLSYSDDRRWEGEFAR